MILKNTHTRTHILFYLLYRFETQNVMYPHQLKRLEPVWKCEVGLKFCK